MFSFGVGNLEPSPNGPLARTEAALSPMVLRKSRLFISSLLFLPLYNGFQDCSLSFEGPSIDVCSCGSFVTESSLVLAIDKSLHILDESSLYYAVVTNAMINKDRPTINPTTSPRPTGAGTRFVWERLGGEAITGARLSLIVRPGLPSSRKRTPQRVLHGDRYFGIWF